MAETVIALDSLPTHVIDIEALIQWALQQTGYLPWRGVSDDALAYDHGWTAVPRRQSRQYVGSEILLRRAVDNDAALVLGAVRALAPATAATVLRCAREGDRPGCFIGFEAHKVPKTVYRRKRGGGKRHRPSVVMVWDMGIEPETVRLARTVYENWRAALARVAASIRGDLAFYEVAGPAAPPHPWLAQTLAA